MPSSDFGNPAGRLAQTMREPPANGPRKDDTAVGIISPAATYPSVPALGFFVDGTKCDSLATNQRGGNDRIIPKRCGPVAITPLKTGEANWPPRLGGRDTFRNPCFS